MNKISEATKRNWKRLNVNKENKKLNSRANKTESKKEIIPIELFQNKKNINIVKNIVLEIKNIDQKINIKQVMYTLSLNYMMKNNLLNEKLQTKKKNVIEYMKEYNDIIIIDKLLQIDIPMNENDILGIIYQSLLKEGNKNEKGSYYTPKEIVKDMLKNIKLDDNQTIIDPCCGTGSFLLDIKTSNPNNIYGIDIDEIAVLIAKTNLIVKYKRIDFKPNIIKKDFLNETINEKFDYIITNPPWGSKSIKIFKEDYKCLNSKESFSYFLYKSIHIVKENGKVIFLLPESFLNVKAHADIRKYVIDNISFEKIVKYSNIFTGVVTKFISIVLMNSKVKNEKIKIYENGQKYFENLNDINSNINYTITTNESIDKKIIKKIYNKNYTTLKNSRWGIGIVTGDNKGKLSDIKLDGYEPIYTGKEISAYNLLKCQKYVKYDRKNFQQVAPDEIYRAPEKLVYKFISKKLTFAYDDTGSLFLNSANILIPNCEKVSKKVVLAFLNSTIFQYLYIKKFGEIKILRGNLEQLPFPILNKQLTTKIENMVDKRLKNEIQNQDIDNIIYEIYNFNKEEIQQMEDIVNGKTN